MFLIISTNLLFTIPLVSPQGIAISYLVADSDEEPTHLDPAWAYDSIIGDLLVADLRRRKANADADLNSDGAVDIFDCIILANNFGNTWP